MYTCMPWFKTYILLYVTFEESHLTTKAQQRSTTQHLLTFYMLNF